MSRNKYHKPSAASPQEPNPEALPNLQARGEQPPHPPEPVIYTAQPAYWILAALALLATVMLAIDMFRGLRWDTLFFSIIGLVGALWALWMANTRVVVLDEGLLVQRATARYLVDYRQLLRAEPSGRFLAVLALIYHPRRDDGIIDTDAVGSLLIPGVRRQDELLQTIEQRLPS